MAELAVAITGMNSGYVVQASLIEAASTAVAADNGRVSDRQGRAQDRPARTDSPKKQAPEKRNPEDKFKTNSAQVTAFFDDLYEPLKKMADDLNVNENLILSLSSYESGWYNDHNRALNNPF